MTCHVGENLAPPFLPKGPPTAAAAPSLAPTATSCPPLCMA